MVVFPGSGPTEHSLQKMVFPENGFAALLYSQFGDYGFCSILLAALRASLGGGGGCSHPFRVHLQPSKLVFVGVLGQTLQVMSTVHLQSILSES